VDVLVGSTNGLPCDS